MFAVQCYSISSPLYRLQSVNETRAGSREGQKAGKRREKRVKERKGGPQDIGRLDDKRERRKEGKGEKELGEGVRKIYRIMDEGRKQITGGDVRERAGEHEEDRGDKMLL